MDEWLAKVYGTGVQHQQQIDLEKVAQLAVLEKLAGEEGYDLSGLSEEQAIELANEVMSAGAQGGGQPQGEPQPQQPQGEPQAEPTQEQAELELAKEAAAKFEEADFLGRVMAHAYTQELEKIAAGFEGIGDAAKNINTGGASGAEAAAKPLRFKARDAAKKGLSAAGEFAKARGRDLAGGEGGSTLQKVLGSGRGAGQMARTWGTRAGVAAGAAGLGYGAYKALGGGKSKSTSEKSKTASAFEKLAEERAMEVLQANGIDPSTGQPMQDPQQDPQGQQAQPQQPQVQPQQEPTPDEQFEDALNARAAEMLQNAGYQIEA